MTERHPTQQHRSQPGFPVGAFLLIVVGLVLLLQTMGIIPWELWGHLLLFWPAVLVIIGINLLMRGRAPWLAGLLAVLVVMVSFAGAYALSVNDEAGRWGATATADLSASLDGAETLTIRIDFGAGELHLGALDDGSPLLVDGRLVTPRRAPEASVMRAGADAELVLSVAEGGRSLWFPGFGRNSADWTVDVSPSPEIRMDVNTGASNAVLDLRDLKVRELTLDTGASNVEVVLPANAGLTTVNVSGGATNVDIVVPESVAARVTSSAGLASVNVDAMRFPRRDGVNESPGFDTAQNRVEIVIAVGLASVTVH